MQGKHRNPGDRSGPGGVGASQAGYRSFGRGGGYRRSGRGKASLYAVRPPPPLPQRRTDVMLEAGRLAAEYLVAKGLLPASSLPLQTASVRSWPNGEGGEIGRTSALARLGRRRFDEEDVGFEPRNHKGRGGRRRHGNGSYSRQGSDWGRENGRSGGWADSWPERARVIRMPCTRNRGFYEAVEGDDSDRRPVFEDSGRGGGEAARAMATDELSLVSKSESTDESESEPESRKLAMTADQAIEAEESLKRMPDDAGVSDLEIAEAEKVKDSVDVSACGETDKKNGLQVEAEDAAAPPCPATEDKQADNCGEAGINLLSLCGFAKVPTKPRSLVPNRNLKLDKALSIDEVEKIDGEASGEGELGAKPERIPGLSPQNDAVTEQSPCSGELASEVSESTTLNDSTCELSRSSNVQVREISRSLSARLEDNSLGHDLMSSMEGRCTRSVSLPKMSYFAHQQQERSQSQNSFQLSTKLFDTGIDGLPEHLKREGLKRPRECSQADKSLHSPTAKRLELLPDHEMGGALEEEQLNNGDSLPTAVADSVNKLENEGQLESSSFKICDLNLVGAPDANNIPDDPVPDHIASTSAPPLSENDLPMDFGLLIGKRCNITVIDLEDSPLQIIACDTSKTEIDDPEYRNLENLLNHAVHNVDLPEIPDGYDLTISEFLGNDMAGCSSVQGDISNLQAGIPFHGAEGIPGVEDSLYVTYGEISFMEVWDQPPPEYGKFF
ncbi:unnamed protein product [Spirodela intermedia]|uniref:Uncharacterized protein n=1 Tax=Spirodela intermedia TaxID=51605 RepID=A0A7I8IUB8_SPIIN|nr:unnamed protein product [Spirodela intermedia]CAA6661565.1 unnamed protein product [Spirodela intermedia]